MGMNADIKRKWVTRLESEQDQQGTGYLNTSAGLCCLGVLCEIAVAEGIVRRFEKAHLGNSVIGYGDDEDSAETAVLPRKVREWAGLDSNNPELIAGYAASALNDELEFKFPQIALLIHEKL